MSKLLVESVTTPLRESGDNDGIWTAVLVTPGAGSSANYSEAALRESGPRAFKAGAHSYITHNRMENGEANPEKLWAVLAEDAVYEEGTGLVGKLRVMPHWREFVEAVAPHTALSIYAMGETDGDGNLLEFSESIDNGIDLVSYAGRPGSKLVDKMYESAIASARAENGTASADSRQTERNTSMEIAELATKVDALTEAVQGLVTAQSALAEALKPAEPSEVDIVAAVDAVLEAKLPKASRTVVLESIGTDKFDATLQAHKTLVESVRTELAETKGQTIPAGRVVEGAQGDQTDYSIGAWS
jgi:hypothetical protein